MRILAVGGAGYIGSHVARSLRRHGYDVLIYDNLSSGSAILARGFKLIRADIADASALDKALRCVDAVIHFAAHAYVHESVINPRKYFLNNVVGGLALLDACLENNVRNFVFSSSCAVYGIPEKIPISEDVPRNPVNPYGVSKMFFERALEAYDVAYGLRFASLRYFNATGADESGEIGEMHHPETHLIPSALAAILGTIPALEIFGIDHLTPDGTCIRDYIHVNDLAEAHVASLEYLISHERSIALNLGTGRGLSVQEILISIEKITGCAVPKRVAPGRPGDPPSLIADPSQARKLLGWKATRSLEDIVTTAWQWAQRSPSL